MRFFIDQGILPIIDQSFCHFSVHNLRERFSQCIKQKLLKLRPINMTHEGTQVHQREPRNMFTRSWIRPSCSSAFYSYCPKIASMQQHLFGQRASTHTRVPFFAICRSHMRRTVIWCRTCGTDLRACRLHVKLFMTLAQA